MGASPLPIQGLHHSCFKTPAKLLSTCPCASLRSSSAFRSRRSAYIQHTRVRERTYQHSAACAASSSFQPSEVVQLNEGCQEQHGGPPAAVRRALGFLAGSLAIAAWFKLSAGRPSSPFCSSTLTAPSHSGLRSVGASAWAGLAAGCLHSLSGPDHLAALTPLTLGISSVKASLLGAWWGFGHCIGQLILGLLMLLLKDRFHSFVPFLDKYSALTIGLTLITIGGLGLYETFAEGPSQVETAAELPPAMQAAGATDQLSTPAMPVEPAGTSARELREISGIDSAERQSKGFSIWTLATGVVYGLQPDALFVIIPALALPTKVAAAAYMAMFVMGTVMAMGSYTAFIGATSRAMRRRGSWFRVENLSSIASIVAIAMGVAVILGFNYSIPFLGANKH